MTFREIAIYADGVNERDREQWKDQITVAWLTAKLSRIPLPQKRGERDAFPSLDSLFPKPTPKKSLSRKQRARENASRFRSWADRHNTRLNKAKKK